MLNYEGDSVIKWLLNFIVITILVVIILTCNVINSTKYFVKE